MSVCSAISSRYLYDELFALRVWCFTYDGLAQDCGNFGALAMELVIITSAFSIIMIIQIKRACDISSAWALEILHFCHV